jgi:hypothetical protein
MRRSFLTAVAVVWLVASGSPARAAVTPVSTGIKTVETGITTEGHYTMLGDTDLNGLMGSPDLPRFYGVSVAYADVRLTVLPEPSVVGVLAGGMLVLGRRRRTPSCGGLMGAGGGSGAAAAARRGVT